MPGDTLYWKYRVFHEPSDDQVPDIATIGHPVPMKMSYLAEDNEEVSVWAETKEVEGTFFVLRPENDHHARVAIAAYAYSCRQEYPQLASDLLMMVEELQLEDLDQRFPEGLDGDDPGPGLRIVT